MNRGLGLKRTPLRKASERRLIELGYYAERHRRFLLQHPYCQVWLAEHGVAEEAVIAAGGLVRLRPGEELTAVPLATQVHHQNKRRFEMLIDERFWLAVSREAHERIERNKGWARASGYLRDI